MKKGKKNSLLSALCPHICYSGKESDIYGAPSLIQVSWIPPMQAVLECRLQSEAQAQPEEYSPREFSSFRGGRQEEAGSFLKQAEQSTAMKEEAIPKQENQWQSWRWGWLRPSQQDMGLTLRESELNL